MVRCLPASSCPALSRSRNPGFGVRSTWVRSRIPKGTFCSHGDPLSIRQVSRWVGLGHQHLVADLESQASPASIGWAQFGGLASTGQRLRSGGSPSSWSATTRLEAILKPTTSFGEQFCSEAPGPFATSNNTETGHVFPCGSCILGLWSLWPAARFSNGWWSLSAGPLREFEPAVLRRGPLASLSAPAVAPLAHLDI